MRWERPVVLVTGVTELLNGECQGVLVVLGRDCSGGFVIGAEHVDESV